MPRVIIMGGSLGGLTAALVLRDAGCDVLVLERATQSLVAQGAGIVLNPITVRYLHERAALELDAISISTRAVRYIGPNGEIVHERPCRYRFSSYTTLYRGLLACLPTECYRLGANVTAFEQNDDEVHVLVSGTERLSCDLLVAADGVRSTARRLLLPDAALSYAGYVAWRGTLPARELAAPVREMLCEAISYHLMPQSHLLTYPIPVVDPVSGTLEIQINWLWYRNVATGSALDELLTDSAGVRRDVSVPAGTVQEQHLTELRSSATTLPPILAQLVLGTARPFIQAIWDLEVERMAFGRVCLIGDAAFVARPHAAAGSAKAAADAWALGEALVATGGDVVSALARWEPAQLSLGRSVISRTRAAGDRAQVAGSWSPGDPLPFGLYREGDSEL